MTVTVAELQRKHKLTITAWETDSRVTQDYEAETLKIPVLHTKYMKVLIEVRRIERDLRHAKSRMKRDLFSYYRGWYNTKHHELGRINRPPFEYALHPKEIEFYVTSDPDFIDASQLHSEAEDFKTDVEWIMEQIASRQWHIRNALDFLKIKNSLGA